MICRFSSLVVFLCLLSSAAFAELVPNPLFSDGAVLQRGQKIPIWGTARTGEIVTVEIQGQKATTIAAEGKWRVELGPLKEGGPFTMTLSGDHTIVIENLLVGEVWLASGQSNMNWPLAHAHNAAEEIPKANYPQIRTFIVGRINGVVPKTEASGSWVACSPETAKNFSAVGYFFARDLQKKLNVPVGIIHSAWGGTPAQAWTSLTGLRTERALGGYASQAKRRQANYPAALAAYPAQLAEYETKLAAWMESTGNEFEKRLAAWKEAAEKAKQTGGTPPPEPRPGIPRPKEPKPPEGGPSEPTGLYNGMIAPLIPYGIKGVIWYQGESNRQKPKEYRILFPTLIADWRRRWNLGDMPFLFVQIAPWVDMPPEIREAQFLTLGKVKNSAMVVTTDVGEAQDIHPTKKEPVGQRLALAARALAYGESIEYSGPLYESMKVEGGKIILNFKHTGTGLVAKDGRLRGFTIAGPDKAFVPATAEIQGNTVVVSAPSITDPVAVRYGWSNVPNVNLFNREGLPASPFRTDVD